MPPGGTYTYTWNTFSWPTTAGVWLYHDHSICDMDNVQLGAIGIIVIHNPADADDVIAPPLPGGSVNGSPLRWNCFPFPIDVAVLPHDLNKLGLTAGAHSSGLHSQAAMAGMAQGKVSEPAAARKNKGAKHDKDEQACEHCELCERCEDCTHCEHDDEAPLVALSVQRGDLILELDRELNLFRRLCNGGGPGDAVPSGSLRSVVINGSAGGRINYQCGIHGAFMAGTIQII